MLLGMPDQNFPVFENMRKTLITGATGFIGRRLALRLNKLGFSVVGSGRSVGEGAWQDFQAIDLTNHEDDLSLEDVDTVFHLASKAHAVSEVLGDDTGYQSVIVEGTRRVVEAAQRDGVRCLVYMSSVKAMGEGQGLGLVTTPCSEVDPTDPQTPYGRCKKEAESIVLRSSVPHVVVLRPVMVYGPGHKGNLVRMAQAIRKRRFPPVSEQGNHRSMVHVDDLVEACIQASNSRSSCNREVYIIANETALSTRELYDSLRDEMGMTTMRWSVPRKVLMGAASLGTLLGKVVGRRMPLDRDVVEKLLGSAWYSSRKSQVQLGVTYRHGGRFLED